MDFKSLGILLAAAAAVVTSVFGLFGSVLQELVPPSQGFTPTLYAGIASLAALLILLSVVMLMPARLTHRQRRWIVGFTAVLGIAAFLVLLEYVGTLNTFVYRYPDAPQAGQKPLRHIRGDYTELGRTITRDMSVAAAIDSVGGLKTVRENQLLWTEQSEKETEMKLVARYVLSLVLLTAALFSVLVAVERVLRAKPESSSRTALPCVALLELMPSAARSASAAAIHRPGLYIKVAGEWKYLYRAVDRASLQGIATLLQHRSVELVSAPAVQR